MFNNFSWENHGHGGHEHRVCRGVSGGKLSFKKMSAGGRLCTLQENAYFWVSTIKVRPPDGKATIRMRFWIMIPIYHIREKHDLNGFQAVIHCNPSSSTFKTRQICTNRRGQILLSPGQKKGVMLLHVVLDILNEVHFLDVLDTSLSLQAQNAP
jgi:hypothetical protein